MNLVTLGGDSLGQYEKGLELRRWFEPTFWALRILGARELGSGSQGSGFWPRTSWVHSKLDQLV